MASTIPFPGLGTPPLSTEEQMRNAENLLHRLPSLPTVAVRLLGMIGRPDVNLKEVSNLIVSDAALSVEIMRMSNSAMFSARSEVRNILQALAILGSEKVKGLACTVALRSYLGNALQIPALKRCWRHNLATAVVSAEIADWAREDSGEAYTAGILHDIGRLGLIAADPARYLQLLEKAAVHGGDLCDHERETYGLDHTAAGEWLATSWGLPVFIRDTIRDHHQLPLNGLICHGCSIADSLGFPVLESHELTDTPIQEFLGLLPPAQRDRLNIKVPELHILIASRVNALEV